MFTTTIEPRVSETDGVGHINNTTVPVWLEAGRNELFRLFMPDPDFSRWSLLVVSTRIDFTAQIYYGEPVEVRCQVSRIGNTSLTLYEEIHQGERLCVKAETTYVHVDPASKKPAPIPDRVREQLQPHLAG